MGRFGWRSRGRHVLLAAAAAGVATITTTFVLSDSAGAIPAGQSKCLFDSQTFTPATGDMPVGPLLSVTVSSPQVVKVEVTADMGVSAGAEVRLVYQLNLADDLHQWGPANFADHQEFFETRSTFALIQVGSGTTRIAPFVHLNGPSSATATMGARCVTVEASTS